MKLNESSGETFSCSSCGLCCKQIGKIFNNKEPKEEFIQKEIDALHIMKLENFTNTWFTFEKNESGFTLILHKSQYNTEEMFNIMGWLHQVGVNFPNVEIKIGALLK